MTPQLSSPTKKKAKHNSPSTIARSSRAFFLKVISRDNFSSQLGEMLQPRWLLWFGFREIPMKVSRIGATVRIQSTWYQPWAPKTYIFRWFLWRITWFWGGPKPSFFMVLGAHGIPISIQFQDFSCSSLHTSPRWIDDRTIHFRCR